MKILVNGFGAHMGGIVRVHNAICRELAAYGEVSVANAPHDRRHGDHLRIVSAQAISRRKSILNDLRISLRPTAYDVRVDSAPAFRFFTRSRHHVVIVHDLNFLHKDIHSISWLQYMYRLLLHHWTLRRCDQVVVNSNSTMSELEGFWAPVLKKAQVLPLPVDQVLNAIPATVTPTDRSPAEGVHVMTFGHAQNKGVQHILHLMAIREDLKLTVICTPENWDRFWSETASTLGVRERVRVKGNLSDAALRCEYENADVFCMLSGYEGFGLPIVEALTLQRPTIINDIPTLVDTGRGFPVKVDPGDAIALSAAVDEALSTPVSRWEEASAAYRHWTWQLWTSQLMEEV